MNREWMREVDRQLRELAQRTADIPVRIKTGGSGGGGAGSQYFVGIVFELPAIPTSGMLEVFWSGDGEGTGDDQVWRVYANQEAWTPTQKFSTLSGEPG